MPLITFTISELKVSFRNKEAVIFSYILPVILLLAMVLVFKKPIMSVLSGISISAILITAFFGTTDWIVILRESGFFRYVRRYDFHKRSIWITFFVSRLLIVFMQMVLLIVISILLNGLKNENAFIQTMVFAMLFSIPMILIGIAFSRFVDKNSVRPICGMSVLVGLFLFGVFNAFMPEFIEAVSNTTVLGEYYSYLFNGLKDFTLTGLKVVILICWLLIPGLFNYIFFKKAFDM